MLSFDVSSSNWGRIQTMMAVRMLSLFTPSGFRGYVILEQNIRVFKRYEGHKAHSGGFRIIFPIYSTWLEILSFKAIL